MGRYVDKFQHDTLRHHLAARIAERDQAREQVGVLRASLRTIVEQAETDDSAINSLFTCIELAAAALAATDPTS